ncbi:MAG: hypothetical protein V8T36_07570 [Ruthenibacterium lactatiformans]
MLVNMLDLLYENCYESTEVLQQVCTDSVSCWPIPCTSSARRGLSVGLLGTIYDYVEENYASPALSLSSIAGACDFLPLISPVILRKRQVFP